MPAYKQDLTTHENYLGRKGWKSLTLFEAVKGLKEFDYPLNLIAKEKDVWGIETLLDFMDHYKRVEAADLSKPIIVSANGHVIDGYHRICKAVMQELKSVKAVQLECDPEPDMTRD